MATRQYIGARYVPFYAGDWDSTKNYEPLTIVTDANGNSFTSIKDVPAGTALTDRNYWIQTSSFSGAVEVLRRDVNALQSGLSSLENEVVNVETDISAINERVSKIVNRKFIFLGDSYAVGFLPGGDEYAGDVVGFYNRVITRLNLESDDYILIKNGRQGFCAIGNDNRTWAQEIDELSSDGEITDIFVMGGLNDVAYSEGQVLTAIGSFVSKCKTKFPNAKIKIGFCGRCMWNSTKATANVRATRIAYQRAAYENGVEYISAANNALFVPNAMGTDGAHPDNIGQNALADVVIASIFGSEYKNFSSYVKAAITPTAGLTLGTPSGGSADGQNFACFVDGDVAKFQLYDTIILTAGAEGFAPSDGWRIGGNGYDILSIDQNSIPVLGDVFKTATSAISTSWQTRDQTKYYQLIGSIRLVENKLNVCGAVMDGQGGFVSGNCRQIYIPPFEIVVPLSSGV